MAQIFMSSLLVLLATVNLCHGFFEWSNCVKPQNATASVHRVHGCEGKEDVLLSCKQGYKIAVIKAFFGHGHGYKTTCDSSLLGQNCGASGAVRKVRFLCQGQQRCVISPTAQVLGATSCTFGLDSDLFVEYVCNKDYVRDTIVIDSLKLSPSPLVLPGTASVSGSVTVKRHLPSTTKLKLHIQKQVVGDAWITVPCVANYGSCTYENFCELLRGVMNSKCDAQMENTGIPCDCPIPTGTFTLPTQSIAVTKEHIQKIPVWNKLVEGRYWVKAEFLDVYDQPLGCITVQAELDINSKKKRTLLSRWSM